MKPTRLILGLVFDGRRTIGLLSILVGIQGSVAGVEMIPGPTWSGNAGHGYTLQNIPTPGGSVGNGFGVGYADRYDAGAFRGVRGIRMESAGPVELGHLGTNTSGTTYCSVQAMNEAGTAVGSANMYAGGWILGSRAVRWDAGSVVATRLNDLGTSGSGHTNSVARAVNAFGTAVGEANRYSGVNDVGKRAVRWNAGVATATELGHLGLSSTGTTYSAAYGVNDSGLVVGYAAKWGPSTPGGDDDGPPGTTGFIGQRPVKWLPGSTIATALGHLGVNSLNYTDANAYGVNNLGTVFGWSKKYVPGGTTDLGRRAVRWEAGSTAATELGTLGVAANGHALADAWAINTAGTIVGQSQEYSPEGTLLGSRAVRWFAAGTPAQPLGRLGTNPAGGSSSAAWGISDSGLIVGSCNEYDAAGNDLGSRAVVWRDDGSIVNLNHHVATGSGWINLHSARGISESDWISGIGLFDSDGEGGEPAFYRMFIMRVPPQPCMGDANGDGSVNFGDITAVLESWGTSGQPHMPGDADGSGGVDFGDITSVLTHFGSACG